MSNGKILILGAGPSAAFAYRACLDEGIAPTDITVYADRPSVPRGCFWLHELPDSVAGDVPLRGIQVTHQGTAKLYAIKQYGYLTDTSWDKYRYSQGYAPGEGIPALWGDCQFFWNGRLSERQRRAMVREHAFTVQTYSNDLRGITRIPIVLVEQEYQGDPMVIYNGERETPWVRQITGWGMQAREYPARITDGAVRVYEQMKTFDTVFRYNDLGLDVSPVHQAYDPEDRVLLVGRFALRNREVLSHHAYADTVARLRQEGVV